MSKEYSLPVGKARVCRAFGATFLLIAVLWGLAAAAQAVVPGWSLECSDSLGCVQTADIAGLLPEQLRDAMQSDPEATNRFADYLARPPVYLGLAILTLVEEGFLVFLFVAVGITLRRLGKSDDRALSGALPWLKRGAASALFWATAQPITDSLRSILLYPVTPDAASWLVGIDLTVAGPALLLAVAAYAIAWALEAGVRAERALAGFV